MKKLLLLPLLISSTFASEDINKRIDTLEHELKTLKQQVATQQDDLDEHIPIIEENEKRSILDKINFSPEILLRMDSFHYKTGLIGTNGDGTTITDPMNPSYGLPRRDRFTKNYQPAGYARVRLNMNADFEDVKFHGRLIYANSSQSNQRLCILSRDIKTGKGGSAFDIDRAYIDYTPNKNNGGDFTLSFGILPTTGGTPMQFAQGKRRSSMFPALVFDMNTYGVIATQRLYNTMYIRAIAAKAYTLRENFYPYQCNRENIDNANVFGLYSDISFDLWGDALFSFGVNVLNGLKAHPYFGPDISSSNSHDLGTMVTYGAGLDIKKFLDTPSIVFFHAAASDPSANGMRDDYKITNPATGTTAGGYPGFTVEDYASGTMLTKTGYALYLGARYDFTSDIALGAEFNYGSKYWFGATQGAEDIFNKLALRGDVYEVYGTWQFYKHLHAKAGYLRMEEDYTGSGWHFGEPQSKDAVQNIYYLQLEARF